MSADPYFPDLVKTTAYNALYTLTEAEQQRIATALRPVAAKANEPKDCHWIHGADDGSDYCRDCALAEIERLETEDPEEEYGLDGGWRTDHDSTPFCEKCHCRLDGALTEYGAEQEIDHFLEYDFDPQSPDDCLSVEEVINTIGWIAPSPQDINPYEHPFTTANNRAARERHWQLGKLARQILVQLDTP